MARASSANVSRDGRYDRGEPMLQRRIGDGRWRIVGLGAALAGFLRAGTKAWISCADDGERATHGRHVIGAVPERAWRERLVASSASAMRAARFDGFLRRGSSRACGLVGA